MDLTTKAIIGLILGGLIVLILFNIWTGVIDLLPKKTTIHEGSVKVFQEIIGFINSEDKDTIIAFYIDPSLVLVGFDKDKSSVTENCLVKEEIAKPKNCLDISCLCLCVLDSNLKIKGVNREVCLDAYCEPFSEIDGFKTSYGDGENNEIVFYGEECSGRNKKAVNLKLIKEDKEIRFDLE